MINQILARKACVLCLVGIPGSGKSTIARAIIELNSQSGSQKSSSHTDETDVPQFQFDDIVLIDYDDLATKQLTLRKDNARNSCSSFDSIELEAWRNSRVVALQILNDSLTTHFTSGTDDNYNLLIIMDDNFHLRSMRREIYRSCQEIIETHPHAQIGFTVLFCSAPLEACFQRNDLRSGKERLPRDVINRMAMGIEPPDGSKACASFERFHLSIDNSVDVTGRKKVDRQFFSELYRCFHESLQSPILQKNELSREEIIKLEQKRMEDREATLNNKFQRIDQLLRKLVSAVGRIQKVKSKEANEVRKSILSMIRRCDYVDSIDDHFIVHQFACSTLGVEVDWHEVDNPLAMAIKDIAQKFQQDNEAK